jgi:hypothetical protein
MEVECDGPMFGIRVAGEMRFGEQIQTGETTGGRKPMPNTLADDTEFEFREDALTQPSKKVEIAQGIRGTTRAIDQPFGPNLHECVTPRIHVPSHARSKWIGEDHLLRARLGSEPRTK